MLPCPSSVPWVLPVENAVNDEGDSCLQGLGETFWEGRGSQRREGIQSSRHMACLPSPEMYQRSIGCCRPGVLWEEVRLEMVGEGANGPAVFPVGAEYLWVLSHAT